MEVLIMISPRQKSSVPTENGCSTVRLPHPNEHVSWRLKMSVPAAGLGETSISAT
jgi:hypothetical protein